MKYFLTGIFFSLLPLASLGWEIIRVCQLGGRAALKDTFKEWTRVMSLNLAKRNSHDQSAKAKKLEGFILPLEDNRSSIIRLG